MRNIVIYGSCVTRDPVSTAPGDFAVTYHHARSNLLSLAAGQPVEGVDAAGITAGGPFDRRCYLADLAKTFRIDFHDQIVIFDFIDDRFATADLGTTCFTLNPHCLAQNPALARLPYVKVIHQHRSQRHRAAVAAAALRRHLAPLFDDNLVVLHLAWFDPDYRGPGWGPAAIRAMNDYYRELYAWLCDLWKPDHCIDLADRLSTPRTHRWGHTPFHYGADYEAAFADRLSAISG